MIARVLVEADRDVVGRDADICGHGHFGATAECVTVQRGDHRRREGGDLVAYRAHPPGHRRGLILGGQLGEFLQIGAGDEGPVSAAADDQCERPAGAVECGIQLVHGFQRDRVAGRSAINGDDRQTLIELQAYVWHEHMRSPALISRRRPRSDDGRPGNPDGKSRREIFGEPMCAIPAFREPGPRLELMTELGIDRSLMFPTLASLIEERMRDDPALIHIVVHALNQWLDEVWGFNYHGRIFTVPVISLPIVEKAIEELDWVVSRGACRPDPSGTGARLSRPAVLCPAEFDPFW